MRQTRQFKENSIFHETFSSYFTCNYHFLSILAKCSFWEDDQELDYNSMKDWVSPEIFKFRCILSFKLFGSPWSTSKMQFLFGDAGNLANFKAAVTDMRYFARSKFSKISVHKKKFSLIWQIVFKLGYLICQERYDTSFEFEWTQSKVTSNNNCR